MYSKMQPNGPSSGYAGADKEVGRDTELMLEALSDGNLAELIIEAARQATSRHVLQQAQKVQSAVEAENSTQHA